MAEDVHMSDGSSESDEFSSKETGQEHFTKYSIGYQDECANVVVNALNTSGLFPSLTLDNLCLWDQPFSWLDDSGDRQLTLQEYFFHIILAHSTFEGFDHIWQQRFQTPPSELLRSFPTILQDVPFRQNAPYITPQVEQPRPRYMLEDSGQDQQGSPYMGYHAILDGQYCVDQFIPEATIGLLRILRRNMKSLFHHLGQRIADFQKNYDGYRSLSQQMASTIRSMDVKCDDDRPFLLLAVSGTGKTMHLEKLLSQPHIWGLYFAAGNISISPPQLQRTDQAHLYEPRRNGCSKDLHWLLRLLKESRASSWLEIWGSGFEEELTYVLIYTRIVLLVIFRDTAQREGLIASPSMWLQFQKQQEQDDLVSSLFLLLLLYVHSYRGRSFREARLQLNYTNMKDPLGGLRLYFAIDEAQSDMEQTAVIASRNEREEATSRSLLQIFLLVLADFRKDLCDVSSMSHAGLIVSGTSLNLQRVQSAVETAEGTDESEFMYQFLVEHRGLPAAKEYKKSSSEQLSIIFTEFPLLTTKEQLISLMEQHSSPRIKGSLQNNRLKRTVSEAGRLLRGRYLWSVMYFEELNVTSLDTAVPEENESRIYAAAYRASERAKTGLKDRLSYLAGQTDPDCSPLLYTLCSMAVRADILKTKTTIDDDDKGHQLIAQGFAQVRKRDVRGKIRLMAELAEQLVIEAAVEWFRKERFLDYEAALVDVLKASNLCSSNLGNMSEVYLPLQLWKCMKPPEDQEHTPIGLGWSDRREKIILKLNEARLLDPTSTSRVMWNEQEKYASIPNSTILLTKPTSLLCSGKKKYTQLVPWLQGIRTSEHPVSGIFFQPADNTSGPDLLFALRVNDGLSGKPEYILCSIQLKVGSITDGELDAAIYTTDIHAIASQVSGPEKQQHQTQLNKELSNWSKIIRILFCTWRDKGLPEAKLRRPGRAFKRRRIEAANIERPKEYFLFCSKQDTETFFGEEYADTDEARHLEDDVDDSSEKDEEDQQDTDENRRRKRG